MIRCPHCGLLHVSSRTACPATGLPIQPDNRNERNSARRTASRPPVPAPVKGAPQTDPAFLGQVLDGRYRVVGVIGQGGMGTVYEAEHLTIGRRVAIKVLKPEHAQKKEAVARLRHEARVVSQIGHPNICEVFDIGQFADGSPYLVMERLRGETLSQRVERLGPMATTELVDVSIQVLAALEAAHRKNIIHRDMKPENVFLAERASGIVAKILDFGISKASVPDEQPHHLTRTGMVMGTPYYMAPEQAMGDRNLDGRVDVWGMGVTFYEALTGQRPFVARNYNALLVQILTATAVPVELLRRDLPAGLGDVVRRALEKKRELRYPTAIEFSQALSPFKGTRPSVLPPRRPASRQGLPRLPVFVTEDSSLGPTDEEPTQQITHRRSAAETDETPIFEENDPTVVDPPKSFLEIDYLPDGRPKR
ncbi:MAG: serine/threonine-protein kinase [Polyangiaceae bacterium]